MSVENSLLGKDTQYPTTYQPDVLFPIARAEARENMRMWLVFNKVKTGGMSLRCLG